MYLHERIISIFVTFNTHPVNVTHEQMNIYLVPNDRESYLVFSPTKYKPPETYARDWYVWF